MYGLLCRVGDESRAILGASFLDGICCANPQQVPLLVLGCVADAVANPSTLSLSVTQPVASSQGSSYAQPSSLYVSTMIYGCGVVVLVPDPPPNPLAGVTRSRIYSTSLDSTVGEPTTL